MLAKVDYTADVAPHGDAAGAQQADLGRWDGAVTRPGATIVPPL
jgi:hypothetical protein